MKNKRLMFFVGMAVSLVFFGWAVVKLDFARALEAIKDIHMAWLLPYAIVFLVPVWLRAVRLDYITESVKKVSRRTLLASICIGYMGNMIFPFRLGELIRVYVVSKKEAVSRSSIFATIVVERIFDIFASAMLVVITILVATPAGVDPSTWNKVEWVGGVFGVVSLGAGIMVFFLAREESFILRWLIRLIGPRPHAAGEKITALLASFQQGLQVMRNENHFWLTILYTFLLFASLVASFELALPLFGITPSLEVALVLTVFAVAGVAVPSAPGAVGTFHAGIVFALMLYGVDASKALGAAIFIHLFMFIFYILTGSYYVWRNKLTFTELRQSS